MFGKSLKDMRTIHHTDRKEHPYGDRTSEGSTEVVGRALARLPVDDGLTLNSPTQTIRGIHEGSEGSIESNIRNRAAQYLASYPGRDSMAGNHHMHPLARKCVEGKCSLAELDDLAGYLEYRQKGMKVAESLVPIMGLDPFVPSWTWSHDEWLLRPDTRQFFDRPRSAVRQIIDAGLIPGPAPGQGRFWIRPVYYLAAAMQAHDLDEAATQEKVDLARLDQQPDLAIGQ
ncbi:MAG: hypothetical protein M1816_007234 [Peltula sp. TS41687]|nr:MAG: hypothetical protein M1816_007234 [Peltula sp. TS41687]